jgi:hypothetical protein
MKQLMTMLMLAVFLLASAACSQAQQGDVAVQHPAHNKGFAVLELFTSEGCSSCPPADALMAKIQRETAGTPVYILAFHVDYWDRQGWKDRFSDAAFSARQRRYAVWLNLETVYTPQLVVNGSSEYIGADEGKISQAMAEALAGRSTDTLALQGRVEGNRLQVAYHTNATTRNTKLLLALVQKNAQSSVRAGENAGRTLSHVQVVHTLAETDIAEGKTVSMRLPDGFNSSDWELIGFVQRQDNGHILTAARCAW